MAEADSATTTALPSLSETITVPRAAWDRKEFELHHLRTLLTTLLADDMLRGRKARARLQEYRAAMDSARRDQHFRWSRSNVPPVDSDSPDGVAS